MFRFMTTFGSSIMMGIKHIKQGQKVSCVYGGHTSKLRIFCLLLCFGEHKTNFGIIYESKANLSINTLD
jgi:hypothetical protein